MEKPLSHQVAGEAAPLPLGGPLPKGAVEAVAEAELPGDGARGRGGREDGHAQLYQEEEEALEGRVGVQGPEPALALKLPAGLGGRVCGEKERGGVEGLKGEGGGRRGGPRRVLSDRGRGVPSARGPHRLMQRGFTHRMQSLTASLQSFTWLVLGPDGGRKSHEESGMVPTTSRKRSLIAARTCSITASRRAYKPTANRTSKKQTAMCHVRGEWALVKRREDATRGSLRAGSKPRRGDCAGRARLFPSPLGSPRG
jgi:hypothetical protein